MRYGIYINDEKRFGGPVKTEDIGDTANRIVSQFNTEPCVRKHEMSAKISDFTDAKLGITPEWFPDILVDVLDTDKSP